MNQQWREEKKKKTGEREESSAQLEEKLARPAQFSQFIHDFETK